MSAAMAPVPAALANDAAWREQALAQLLQAVHDEPWAHDFFALIRRIDATRALALFATEIDERPLFARVATDNVASLHVLQKCGFVIYGAARGYADARGMEIDEYLLRLD